MITGIAVALSWVAIAAQPDAYYVDSPALFMAGEAPTMVDDPYLVPPPYGHADADCAGCSTGRCRAGCCIGESCWCSPCNLIPHYPYYPAAHGYYYFRPYHYTHIALQQHLVSRWGGDPRHPYANEIFDRVYAELDAEGKVEDAAPLIEVPSQGLPKEELPMAPNTIPMPKANGKPNGTQNGAEPAKPDQPQPEKNEQGRLRLRMISR